MSTARSLNITYVPESFPQISETFVVNEIWGLAQRGHSIVVTPRGHGNPQAWECDRFRWVKEHILLDADNTLIVGTGPSVALTCLMAKGYPRFGTLAVFIRCVVLWITLPILFHLY